MAKVVTELSTAEKQDKQILDTLAELGGKKVGAKDIEFGKGFMLPDSYRNDVEGAIGFLMRWHEAQSEITDFTRTMPYKPWDGAVAVMRSFEKNFGTQGVAISSIFSKPEMYSIPVGVNEELQVPWGKIEVPVFRGRVNLGSAKGDDEELLFQITVTTAKKNEGAVEGLFKMIRDELDTNSIYRGKAVDGSDMPKFLDTSKVDKDKLVFNEVTDLQLRANILAPIAYRNEVLAAGIDAKRTAMLEGPWGTGKSEFGLLVAKLCQEVGRTFILCNPKDNNVYECLSMAAMYQPACVFVEDIDVLASDGDPRAMQRLLDAFDGLTSKGKDIMVIMTTNHKERIPKGLLRPGRLDAIIHMGPLDREPTERLVRQLFAENLDHIDFDKLFEAVEGFTPAFVDETCKKVKLFSIARADGDSNVAYETLDFLGAAEDMRSHHNLHELAGEGVQTPALEQALSSIFDQTLDKRYIEDENGVTASIEHRQD